jgi:phosphatidylserine/phosphatidylglycerophosphate/cardiolipin synthase-like enzyme
MTFAYGQTAKHLLTLLLQFFEDLWTNSSEIENKIIEMETDKSPYQELNLEIRKDEFQVYIEALNSAEKEIFLITTSDGLIENWKNSEQLKKLTAKGVSIKILSSITNENLQAALHLLNICEIRHVRNDYPPNHNYRSTTSFPIQR